MSAGIENSVFLTLGTGVGGGIVLGGKVYSGTNGVGSELGHMITVIDGELCTCGNRGCWERYASATALIRMGREAAEKHPESRDRRQRDGRLDDITPRPITTRPRQGDERQTRCSSAMSTTCARVW